jgi:hypothetical protein
MTVSLRHPAHPHRPPRQPRTPELDLQHEALESGHPQVLGEFLDHLQRSGIVLARWADDDRDVLYEISQDNNRLLADFLGIDLDRIERERMALLRWVRATHEWNDARAAAAAGTNDGEADA